MPEVNLVPTEAIMAAFRRALIAGVHEGGLAVQGEAQREAPIAPAPYKDYSAGGSTTGPRGGRYDLQEPGRLRQHVEIEFQNAGDGGYEAVIYDDMPYAAVQHERLDFHHTHGKAKFLEDPLKREGGKLRGRIEKHLAAELTALGRP